MKLYEVFRSEGGYRVCGGLWNDNPIMDQCPWYETESLARDAAQSIRYKRETEDVKILKNDYVVPSRWTVTWSDEYGSEWADYPTYPETLRAAREIVKSRGFSDSEIDKFRPSWALKRLDRDESRKEDGRHV